jgi:uncharacterized protein with ATP-grasp and redox domains
MHIDCEQCLYRQIRELFKKHHIRSASVRDKIMGEIRNYVNNKEIENISAPEASRYANKIIQSHSGIKDLYFEEKQTYNQLLLGLYDELMTNIRSAGNPKNAALRYALAGNIIDFGPPRSFDIHLALASALKKEHAIDHSEVLFGELRKAKTVLYLGDNAGEIVTDKLFISTIRHQNLYFAVRGAPVMNDVTLEDAYFVGMDKVARIISNGYDAPSTLLTHCSPEFLDVYEQADMIISKGQGNLEGLIDEEHKKIFFLLTVKCDIMGEKVGAKVGDVVIWYNRMK